MKLSNYILILEELLEVNGDLDVETTAWDGERIPATQPGTAYKQILKGRERKPRFWYTNEQLKGEKVIRV